ncbi:mCG1036116, partial [Mus musculus]
THTHTHTHTQSHNIRPYLGTHVNVIFPPEPNLPFFFLVEDTILWNYAWVRVAVPIPVQLHF